MRGKAGKLIRRQSGKGITPAYAGKSLLELVAVVSGRDHPRLCGEKCAEPSIVVTIQGSPPPMRGKVVRAIPDILRKRITPAYAGKRRSPETFRGFLRDHPRLCGEKRNKINFKFIVMGSPPPMRGKGASPRCRFCF